MAKRCLVGFVALLGVLACGGAQPPSERAPLEPGPSARGEGHPGSREAAGHGEGRHHRFEDAETWARRFEDPGRDEWQKPEVVLEILELGEATRVADIGSATGYFPVRIAARTKGRVWGVDIEPDMVRYLNARARKEGLTNLFSVLGTPGDPLLPEPVDRVLIVDTYHHIAHRVAYFRSLARYLAPGGRVVIVDFKKGDIPVGPPDSMKIPPNRIEAEMAEAGYRLDAAEHERLPYQFVLVFERR